MKKRTGVNVDTLGTGVQARDAEPGPEADSMLTTAGPPTPPPSAEPLLAACMRGDQTAFRDLFLRYQHRVYSIALHYTANPAAAMDIAQDVFVKLYSQLGSYRGQSSFETWLFRMVANCCHDRYRREKRLVGLDDPAVPPIPKDHVSDDAERADVARQVQRAVASLPEDLRMTVVLRYTEGLAYDEIAAILGCPGGTVASRLNRAHRELAGKLKDLEGI